jgi:hypothetical protein
VSIKSLLNRLDKLDADPVNPAECTYFPTCVVFDDGLSLTYMGGEHTPYDPETAPRCPRCGGTHELHIVELIVETREQVEALDALPSDYTGPWPEGVLPSGVYHQQRAAGVLT